MFECESGGMMMTTASGEADDGDEDERMKLMMVWFVKD